KPDWFVGFVDVLRGQPVSPDGLPSGEVHISVYMADEMVRARAVLNATDYALAGAAHLAGDPVYFRGVLVRLPRLSRIDQVTEFRGVRPIQSPDGPTPTDTDGEGRSSS